MKSLLCWEEGVSVEIRDGDSRGPSPPPRMTHCQSIKIQFVEIPRRGGGGGGGG